MSYISSGEGKDKKDKPGASILNAKRGDKSGFIDADIAHHDNAEILANNKEYQAALKNFAIQSAKINSYLASGSRGTFFTHSNLVSSIPTAEIQALLEAFVDVCASVSSEQGKVIFERAKMGLQTAMLLDDEKNKKAMGSEVVEEVLQAFEKNLTRPEDKYKPTEEDLNNIKAAIKIARTSLSVLQDNAKPTVTEQVGAYFGAFIGAMAGVALGPLIMPVVGVIGLIATARYYAQEPKPAKPSPEGLATAGVLGYTVALPVLGQVAAIGLGILGAVCGSKALATLGRRRRGREVNNACNAMHAVLRDKISGLKKWEDSKKLDANDPQFGIVKELAERGITNLMNAGNGLKKNISEYFSFTPQNNIKTNLKN